MFVFSPNWEYCVQQYPDWKKLSESIDEKRWRVITITSEPDINKIKEHQEKYEIENLNVATITSKELLTARLGFTPMTVTIGTDGTVEKVWSGLWKQPFDLSN